jgi:hypothetical protein
MDKDSDRWWHALCQFTRLEVLIPFRLRGRSSGEDE